MIITGKQSHRWLRLLCVVLAMCVFAASCGDDDAAEEPQAAPSDAPGPAEEPQATDEAEGDTPEAVDEPQPAEEPQAADEPQTITVAFNAAGDFPEPKTTLNAAKESFEAANPGVTVELVQEVAQDADFHTKLQLQLSSGSDVPDVMYYAPSWIAGDAAAGYLSPLDDDLAGWDEWNSAFPQAVRDGAVSDDGHTYGVPLSSNSIGIWYNRNVFAEAGLPEQWQPESWADLRAAAETIQAALPGVIPAHFYVGKASGPTDAILKTFQPLLYGTGDTLFDFDAGLWQPAGDGFVATMTFIADHYADGLAAPEEDVLSPNIWAQLGPWMQGNQLGFAVDGNWMSFAWVEGGPNEWPEWGERLGVAAVPNQNGDGFTTMAVRGWTLARAAGSDSPDLAFEFIKHVASKDLALGYSVNSGQLAVRSDVLTDPAYAQRPTVPEFSALLEYAAYVPQTEENAKVELLIGELVEAVALGDMTPQEAADAYNAQMEDLVGSDLYAG